MGSLKVGVFRSGRNNIISSCNSHRNTGLSTCTMAQRFRNLLRRGTGNVRANSNPSSEDMAKDISDDAWIHIERSFLLESGQQMEVPQRLGVTLTEERIHEETPNMLVLVTTTVVDKELNVTYVHVVASVSTTAVTNAPAEAAIKAADTVRLGATNIIAANKGTPVTVSVPAGAIAIHPAKTAIVGNTFRGIPKKVAHKSQDQLPPHRGHRRCSVCF
ncbi:hypothetical protein QBC43DRAFT_351596 [Cladorrhinum sp. PSN259]|nr:hypothetical protein QBC43DRAFT_351596 [Cladorrhinum sp. PSN259]